MYKAKQMTPSADKITSVCSPTEQCHRESEWLGSALTSSGSDLGPPRSCRTVLRLRDGWISPLVFGLFMICTSFSSKPSAASRLSVCEKSKIVNGAEGHLTLKFITSQNVLSGEDDAH